MESNVKGADASPAAYVYTTNDVAHSVNLLPLLIDRLGKPGEGNRNRLILLLPLFDWADDQPPSLRGSEVSSNSIEGGGNDAVPS
jgi:hypothetical protein